MLELLMCGYNLTCGFNTLVEMNGRPKYPPDVESICQYFDERKLDLPDYCKWKDKPKLPRKRSEF